MLSTTKKISVMKIGIALRDVSEITGKWHVKIYVSSKGSNTVYIPTGIYVRSNEFDDANGEVVNIPLASMYNAQIADKIARYKKIIFQFGDIINDYPAKKIKEIITKSEKNKKNGLVSFISVANDYISELHKEGREGYATTLESTNNVLKKYFKSKDVYFIDLDSDSIAEFKRNYVKNTGKEVTANKHLRNIKRIYNLAIAKRLIDKESYPFDAISIPSDYNARIRKLDAAIIKVIYNESGIGRDFFMLSFFFCGMNLKDIFEMEYFPDIIDIDRAKTSRTARFVHLRLSIPAEAKEILARYADPSRQKMILTQFSHERYLNHRINDDLYAIAAKHGFKRFSFTYARHSWATIAGRLRISDDVIDKAQMRSVTGEMIERYREYDFSQVEEANRKVIDHTLYIV